MQADLRLLPDRRSWRAAALAALILPAAGAAAPTTATAPAPTSSSGTHAQGSAIPAVESDEQKAARHAELAASLAEKGMKDLAQAEVAKALEFKLENPALLVSLARTDLMTGNVKGAEGLLSRVPSGRQAPAELNVLKGWCAIQGEHWAEAKTLLTEATKGNPEPAGAFYLLGRVYEHEGDMAHAAECYRKAFEHSTEGKPMNQ
jgi:Flp pilus assembly protein TadD